MCLLFDQDTVDFKSHTSPHNHHSLHISGNVEQESFIFAWICETVAAKDMLRFPRQPQSAQCL